jgi:hypothetical protein
MKIRIMKLSPERFMQLLQGKNPASNLPADTEVLDVKLDLFAKQVLILLRSEIFEDTHESMPFPEFIVATAPETKFAPKPSPATTTAVKPEVRVEPKPTVSKLVPPQPDASRWASKMENEFSPDQRKLLSFSVRDEVMVVKPVSFLKAEWEDINEVVRSLGGKWVKGDIISYWEIPLQ